MATDWKTLSPEKRAELNEKRKHKYRQLEPEAKAIYQATARAQYTPVNQPTSFTLTKDDGSKATIDDPEMVEWLAKLETRVKRKQTRFRNRIDRIQAWVTEGGKYPSPNIQDKIDTTEAFAKVAHVLGRRCHQCGDWKVFDFSWRITRKDDFLAFVHFTKENYERVLLRPQDYALYCIRCSFDLRIYTFAWLFSPYSPRNNPSLGPCRIAGKEYDNWNNGLWAAMYPADEELFRRIRQGYIKSLTCGLRRPNGDFVPTFLRKCQYHGWVGLQPRDIHPAIMARVAGEYTKRYPDTDTAFWGIGKGFNDDNQNDLDLTDNLKRFLKEIPPGWQKQRNQTPKPSQLLDPSSPEYLTTLALLIPPSTLA